MTKWGELTFRIVRIDAGQEVLALAGNFTVARAAFDTSVALWPAAWIELRQGARDAGRRFHFSRSARNAMHSYTEPQ